MNESPRIAFFGGEPLGLPALEALITAGLSPSLVFCNPDRPKGRGHQLQAPPIKTEASKHTITVLQPSSFKDQTDFPELTNANWDLFIVVAYNFILPDWLLALPKHGVINVHPSLLPKLRGASPIRTAILENKPEEIGLTIMLMDEKMDHGPILAQTPYQPTTWPIAGPELDRALATAGAALLTETIPKWLKGTIAPQTQQHEAATYTKKITKSDSELFINPFNLPTGDEAQAINFKIHAFAGNPGTYFFYQGKRVKIITASIRGDGQLEIEKVVPEGKSETTFLHYLSLLSE